MLIISVTVQKFVLILVLVSVEVEVRDFRYWNHIKIALTKYEWDLFYRPSLHHLAFKIVYDQFGDSYGSRATLESLEYSMKQVEVQELELKNLNAFDIADIEDQYGISGEYFWILFYF